MERWFELRARGSDLRTEVVAGITTFLTMAYIIALNPLVLSGAGMPVAGVAAATCIAAGIASILMGLIANCPLALAPGMGLNAYFTYTVVAQMHVPWQTALGCVFLSGVAFLLLTAMGVSQLIVAAIPRPLMAAVAGGIGLFIAFIGLRDAGLVIASSGTTVTLGDLHAAPALVALLGLLLIAALMAWRVKGAILISIVVASLAAWALGLIKSGPQEWDGAAMTATAFKLDIGNAMGLKGGGGAALVEIFFVFLFVDLLDNVGTLVAVTKRAGLVKEDGTIPGLNRILLADSLATMLGAVAGTSTVTSYIESAAGVAAGGRTGLASVVTGLLFLLAIFAAPLVGSIPAAATAPALILVGGMMMAPLSEIDWHDPEIAVPAFLALITIPLTFSIANGLAFGITSYALLQLLRGKARKADWLLYLLAILFIVRFAYLTEA